MTTSHVLFFQMDAPPFILPAPPKVLSAHTVMKLLFYSRHRAESPAYILYETQVTCEALQLKAQILVFLLFMALSVLTTVIEVKMC